MVPKIPIPPCKGAASKASSTYAFFNKYDKVKYTIPPNIENTIAAQGCMVSQDPVIATNPASIPLQIIGTVSSFNFHPACHIFIIRSAKPPPIAPNVQFIPTIAKVST